MQGFWGWRVFLGSGFLVGDVVMKSSGCLRGCAELVKRWDIARISHRDISEIFRTCGSLP
jgi:hypothetical protein